MSIFKTWRNIKALARMVFTASTWRSWLMPRSNYNYKRDVGDGFGSSVVMAPVLWIARTFPEAPLCVEFNNELERDHDLVQLINKPNPYYSGHILMMATIISFNTDGNGYWIKIRNSQRKVIQLWYAPHWMMEPKWPEDGSDFISHYEYMPNGVKIKIEREDVVHFRYGLDPQNTRKGLSPLASLLREVFTDDEAANYTAMLLKNCGVPGLVISPAGEGAVSPDDAQATKDWFKKHTTGDRRGEPLVMRSKTEVKQFAFSPKDMELGNLRDIPEERVCAILGIPAAVVGFGTGLQQTKVGATMKEMRELAYEGCIIPMQRLIASEMDSQILSDFDTRRGAKTKYDLSKVRVLQEDQNKLAERLGALTESGLITVAEARGELGYEIKPEHEIYLRKFNMIVVPAGEDQTTPAQGDHGQNNGKGWIDEFLKTLKAEAWQQRLIVQLYKDQSHLAGIFEPEVKKAFNKIGDVAASVWLRISEQRGIDYAKSLKSIIDDEVYAQLVLDELMSELDYTELLSGTYKTHFLRTARQTYDTINTVTGLAINLTDPAELRIAEAGGKHLGLIDLTEEIKTSLFQTLSEGREAGEGPIAVARMIRDKIPAGPWSSVQIRSRIIARTETKYAQNVASLEAYRESDTIESLQVWDGQLPTSDDECIERNGDIVTFAEAEEMNITEHPNGTLSFAPVIRRS